MSTVAFDFIHRSLQPVALAIRTSIIMPFPTSFPASLRHIDVPHVSEFAAHGEVDHFPDSVR